MKNKKRMIALILSVVMTFAIGICSYATDTYPGSKGTAASNTGTEASPATVKITKNLYMSSDLTTPTKTFTFTFTKKSIGETSDDTTLDDLVTESLDSLMPTIENKTITIAEANTTKYFKKDMTNMADSADADHIIKVVTNTTDDILSGITWPHAGIYTYTVTEIDPSDTEIDPYSKAEYDMVVYVKNKASSDDVYVAAVGVLQNKTDDGTAVADDKKKIDASESSGLTGAGSQFAFRNDYIKFSDLTISKAVSGNYADRTKLFTYELTLTNPTVGTTKNSYTAKIYNGTTASGETIEFAPDTAKTFKLKHNQSLKFIDDSSNGVLPVGMTYVLTESAEKSYKAEANVTYNADDLSTATPKNIANTEYNKALTLDDSTVDGTQRLTTIGEKHNQAAFINTYKDITPTGLIINNLPYIILAVVIILALALTVVFKRRSK